jgi:hypothetical protein
MDGTMNDGTVVGWEKTMVTVHCCCDWAWDTKWCPWSHGTRGLMNRTKEDGTVVGLKWALVTDCCCSDCVWVTMISWDARADEWALEVMHGDTGVR